ncbi:MAG: universal stress protein [Rhodospirillales bacterium]|nr:universal stress protein [Rhodospirillales bacterium]
MTEQEIDSKTQEPSRTFLLVVDSSEEFSNALRFVWRRAKKTNGRVALLYVIERAEFQHWIGVGKIMEEERRQEAEELLNVISANVQAKTGKIPLIFLREGNLKDEVVKLIDEEDSISVLVLGAAVSDEGPGNLVSHITGNVSGKLRVPVTIVPGNLTDDEIDAIT